MYLFLLLNILSKSGHDGTLHSTMYLFLPFIIWPFPCGKLLYIPQCIYFYRLAFGILTTHTPLHSTMYLFLRSRSANPCMSRYSFTFHNVSISTKGEQSGSDASQTLHSTMYLFLRSRTFCFYIDSLFTFHNVSISTQALRTVSVLPQCLYIPQCIYFYYFWDRFATA